MKTVQKFENNNKILNYKPKIINSKINFIGKNNILICEEGITIKNSYINFEGDNSIIYLSSNNNIYFLHISINNNSIFFIDENCYFNNNKLYVILSETKNVFIGKNCLFSFGIWIRLADAHLIYDNDNLHRLNMSDSVYIGDHVWIGQEAMILKGTQIGSGSIIGAKSLVANKKIPSNTIWGGNPAKEIKDNVFFNSNSVHHFSKKDSKNSMVYKENPEIFKKDVYTLGFNYLKEVDNFKTRHEKIKFLKNIRQYSSHNRFFVAKDYNVLKTESFSEKSPINKKQLSKKLNKYNTARIDIYLDGENKKENALQLMGIDDYLNLQKLPWMEIPSSSLCITNKNNSVNFIIKCLDDGNLNIKLRGVHYKFKNKIIPVFINYTELQINEKSYLTDYNIADHDNPIIINETVTKNEILNIHIEWTPC